MGRDMINARAWRRTYDAKRKKESPSYQENARLRYKQWLARPGHLYKERERKRIYQAGRNQVDTLKLNLAQDVYENNIKKYKTLTCELCCKPVKFGEDSIDHLTPIKRNGLTTLDNLGIAHLKCNISKGKKTMEEYKLWQIQP